jgi:NAD(P)-dependent dehydrogenase (short-subunit alcohol dehydrogenase family)
MWDAAPEPQRSALLSALAERTITKTVGEPGEIAAAHLYLMDNGFVTGTVLTVDGGCRPALTLSGGCGASGRRCG